MFWFLFFDKGILSVGILKQQQGAMPLSLITLSKMTLSKIFLSIMVLNIISLSIASCIKQLLMYTIIEN